MPLTSCTLCGGPMVEAFTNRDRNRRITAERFTHLRCSRCGMLKLADPPADLGAYYAGDYFGFPSAEELTETPLEERAQLERLKRHAAEGPIVEVGPGRGMFAAAARAMGFDVEVLERDLRSCNHLREVVGVRATQTEQPEALLRQRRDLGAVVMWQVIEHLPEPWEVLEAAAAALRPGGVVLLATPNQGGLQARLLRGRWPHIDAPRHLQIIPATALIERAATMGLEALELSSNDPDGRRWSEFGWQRVLMNETKGRLPSAAAFWMGTLLARALWPLEARRLNAATYTTVLRKL